MGDGDEWPGLREKVMAADILLLATPIWLGHPSSLCQRVLERLNADISETDDGGRQLTYGKVAMVAVVGNEDGAHKVSADAFQGLNDLGFTLAPGAVSYWVGEAQHGTDYQDLEETPEAVRSTTHSMAVNAAHLARVLADAPTLRADRDPLPTVAAAASRRGSGRTFVARVCGTHGSG